MSQSNDEDVRGFKQRVDEILAKRKRSRRIKLWLWFIFFVSIGTFLIVMSNAKGVTHPTIDYVLGLLDMACAGSSAVDLWNEYVGNDQ